MHGCVPVPTKPQLHTFFSDFARRPGDRRGHDLFPLRAAHADHGIVTHQQAVSKRNFAGADHAVFHRIGAYVAECPFATWDGVVLISLDVFGELASNASF